MTHKLHRKSAYCLRWKIRCRIWIHCSWEDESEGRGICIVTGKGLDDPVKKVLGRLGVLAMKYRYILAIEYGLRPLTRLLSGWDCKWHGMVGVVGSEIE